MQTSRATIERARNPYPKQESFEPIHVLFLQPYVNASLKPFIISGIILTILSFCSSRLLTFVYQSPSSELQPSVPALQFMTILKAQFSLCLVVLGNHRLAAIWCRTLVHLQTRQLKGQLAGVSFREIPCTVALHFGL